jgi:hypothetical protein
MTARNGMKTKIIVVLVGVIGAAICTTAGAVLTKQIVDNDLQKHREKPGHDVAIERIANLEDDIAEIKGDVVIIKGDIKQLLKRNN